MLLIDLSEQGNASLALGVQPGRAAFRFVATGVCEPVPVRATEDAGCLFVLPGDELLETGNALIRQTGITEFANGLLVVKESGRYDHIVIDTQEGSQLASAAALASDAIVLPTQPEPLPVDAAYQQIAILKQIGAGGQIFVIPTMVDDRTGVHKRHLASLLSDTSFVTLPSVPLRTSVRQAQDDGKLPSEMLASSGIVPVVMAYQQAVERIIQ